MKKSFSLILVSCFFALPAYAQTISQTGGQASGQITTQTANQASQSTKTTTTKNTAEPVQVNVTINNSASAQGNTQTADIDNTQNQTAATAAASPKTSGSQDTVKSSSGFGDYASSPYHSNMQVELLRNSVWEALVPRKKLYEDPAGKNAGRYSYGTAIKSQTTAQTSKTKSSTAKTGKSKSSTAQTSKTTSRTAQSNKNNSAASQTNASNLINSQTIGTQNLNLDELKQKLATGQMILLEQKDGEICIPLEHFAQLSGVKPEQEQSPGTGAVNGAGVLSDINNFVQYSPLLENTANGANTGTGSSAVPAGQTAVPSGSAVPFSPVNSANSGISADSNLVSPASSASSVSPANAINSAASPANPPRNVTPLGGDTENDIFAIPSNPFEPVSPAGSANPAVTGNADNPLGQNPMARDPLAPQAQGSSQRDISITQNPASAQMTVNTQTNP